MTSLKIASWNVNSINARLPNFLEWCKQARPDVILLQELKCMEEKFPRMEIEDLGYNLAIHGQKTYNGVAIISKYPIDEFTISIPNFEDENSRYIEGIISCDTGAIRVASVYVPNGNQVDSDKFEYKMRFFDALKNHMKDLLEYDEKIIIGGDFNVAIKDMDVYDPKSLRDTICFHPQEQEKMRKLLNLPYLDIFRLQNPTEQTFSWWDYRGNAWGYNKGMRIDYLLANALAADSVSTCHIDTETRAQTKASDHAPVVCEIEV